LQWQEIEKQETMKPFGWHWLVISSLIAGSLAAAETRPQYGGTLRVAVRAAPSSLDPADSAQPDSFARRNLALLIFETLVTNDENGRLRPGLAVSWQASVGDQRWQFRLRHGVKFHDGTSLTPEIAAGSLRTANPSWSVRVEGESVVIERDTGDPELPAELALSRNAIVKRNSDGKLSGTGPFHVVDFQPGKKVSLGAEETHWRGRPFLDTVEIELGKNLHDSLIALELGRADLVEVASEQSHRVSGDGRRVANSAPMELVALLFARDAQSPEEKLLREALALSVDRASMRSVLLQGAGQPAGGVLPNWMSGYEFVFPTEADLARARHDREQARAAPSWTIGYDASDPIARVLAERIALNARDAGLSLQPRTQAGADLQLVRIPLAAVDPWMSLMDVAAVTGLSKPKSYGGSAEDLYLAEQAMLATQRFIPLFHLPATYAAATTLRNWSPRQDGSWNLADVWLGNEKL
jgi:ABC-type transport system substrate-binding protein